jgi:hypothetical protein
MRSANLADATAHLDVEAMKVVHPTATGRGVIRGSGGADIGEESADIGAQRLRLLAEFLGRD